MYEKSLDIYQLECAKVREICSPLFSFLKIQGLTYQRIYPDGNRICLSESEKWLEFLFSVNHATGTTGEDMKEWPRYMLWKTWPENDSFNHFLFQNARENFNFDNGLFAHRVHRDYIETFTLRGEKGDEGLNNRYISNLDIINNFFTYFVDKIEKNINKIKKSIDIIDADIANKCQKKDMDLINSTDIKNDIFYNSLQKNTMLTRMEMRCLINLMFGLTSKQIGNNLGISFRTVESHLNNIRFKLGSPTKSSIVKKYFETEMDFYNILKMLEIEIGRQLVCP